MDTYGLHGQKNILDPALSQEGGLRNSSTLELSDALSLLHPDNFGCFVRFDMRAKAIHITNHVDHRGYILLYPFRVDKQGRRNDVFVIFK
jgi:hypothetical protein